MTFSLLIAACLAAASPAAAGRKPDWIERESGHWPREMYVLGVGMADDRAAAEDRARAEIARVFTTRVTSVLESSISESSLRENGRSESRVEVSAADDTRSTADKVLEGVEIVETWRDPETRQTYALAALDRQQAARRVGAQLDGLEASAKPLRTALDGPDKAQALLSAIRLIRSTQSRQALVTDLRIILPTAKPRDVSSDAEAARNALSRVSVGMTIAGDADEAVKSGVASGLAALGISLKGESDGADLVGEASVSVEDLGRRDGWYWARATIGLVLRDPSSARVVVSVNESAREAARLQPEAGRRVLHAVSEKLRRSVPAAFMAWADAP